MPTISTKSYSSEAKLSELISIAKALSSNEITFISPDIKVQETEEIKLENLLDDFNDILLNKNPGIAIQFLRSCGILDNILPELSRCWYVKQNPKYHIDNVFEHCIKVCSIVKPDIILRWAGLLHDIGKYDTAKFSENYGMSFHKHEVFGESIVKEVVSRFQLDTKTREDVIFLVRNHMYHYDRRWTDKAVWRFIRKTKITEKDIEKIEEMPLFILRKADRMSRGLDPISEKQVDFESRIIKVFKERSEQ